MTIALWFLVAWVVVLLIVDIGFWLNWYPGGTISRAIANLAVKHPILWRMGYVLLAVVGYWHFYGS